MLDKIRRTLRPQRVSHALRAKAVRVVDEVVRRYHREQSEQIEDLRQEVAGLRQELHLETGRTIQATKDFEIRARRDLLFAGEREAATTSAQFVRDVMGAVPHFPQPHPTLEYALTLAPEGGMALEFGVWTGGTLKLIAEAREGNGVYGFDSFEGLPENWRSGFPAGMFGVDGLPDVPGAELVVGWFDDTLPVFLEAHQGPVSFLHVDCDLYSSTRTVLELVGPRLGPGSVIVFDEYFNFPGWQEHEHRAWTEYVEKSGIQFGYEAYTIDHEQVVVRVTAT